MLELREVEVGVQLPVDHREHVLVELCGDSSAVVVGGLEPADVLHEIGAEQQAVAGLQSVGQIGEELFALGRLEVADRAAEEGDEPAAAGAGAGRGGARSRRRRRALRARGTRCSSARPAARSVDSLTSNGT